MRVLKRTVVVTLLAGVAAGAALAGPRFTAWTTAQKIDEVGSNHADLNTSSLDGFPIQSPDGLSPYMASNRPGGKGGLDIWVAARKSASGRLGAPVNLPEPINSAADDFCPTPIEGDGLLFVSRRVVQEVTCGLGHLLHPSQPCARLERAGAPQLRSCRTEQRARRAGPIIRAGTPELLARHSAPRGTPASSMSARSRRHELHGRVADRRAEGRRREPSSRTCARTAARSSSRRIATAASDIWSATRANIDEPWSAPVNLGSSVNTALGESRPALSRDAEQLLLGRAGPVGTGEGGTGASDIYVTTRAKAGD